MVAEIDSISVSYRYPLAGVLFVCSNLRSTFKNDGLLLVQTKDYSEWNTDLILFIELQIKANRISVSVPGSAAENG